MTRAQRAPGSSATGLGIFYAAIFVGTGAAAPYMPLWFAARGLSGAEIGVILSAPLLARAVTAPAIAVWADGFRLRRAPLVLMSLATAGAYALMAAPFGFWWWLAVWFCAASVFSTISPLADTLALARARRDGFNYGWPRGFGSIGYILANLAMGALLVKRAPDLVLAWIVAAALLMALAARAALPPDPVHEATAPDLTARLAGLGGLLRDRTFMIAVVSAGLIQSAHAFYYGFSTLAWKRQGVPEDLIGALWAVGVVLEIGFMWFLEPWRRRVGPVKVLILAGVASAMRWTALAFSPPLWLLFPVQALHALSFGATFLAALQLTDRLSSRETASAGQAVNSALSGGLLAGVATIASGWMFDRGGALGYLAMTAMCLFGLAGAAWLATLKRPDL